MANQILTYFIQNIWPIKKEIIPHFGAIATILALFVAILHIAYEIHKYKQNQKNKKIRIIDNLIIELKCNRDNELQSIQDNYKKHITKGIFPMAVKLKTEIINDIFKMITIYDNDLVVSIMEVRIRLNLINEILKIMKQCYVHNSPISAQKHHLTEMNRLAKELFVKYDSKKEELLISGGLIKNLIEKLEEYKKRILEKDYE